MPLVDVLTRLLPQSTGAVMELWELLDVPGPPCQSELPVPQTVPHPNSTLQYKPTPLSQRLMCCSLTFVWIEETCTGEVSEIPWDDNLMIP